MKCYEDRIVAFIDILGFSNLIHDSNAGNVEDEAITGRIHSFIQQMLDDFVRKRPYGSMIGTQFSDSIVISYKMTETSAVFNLLLSIMFLIIEASRYDLLLRGGITVGLLCHNKKELFGPAMVEAYNLESKTANFPRIILSNNVIRLAGKFHANHHTSGQEMAYVKSLLKQDEDGFWFVDYFESPNGNFDDEYVDYRSYLQKLRSLIENNLKIKNKRVQEKMHWMAYYYNKALKKMKSCHRENFSFDYEGVFESYQKETFL